MWSIFDRKGGPHHPDDAFEELGDRDEVNFKYFMMLMARLLEGRPIKKCVFPYSLRGRNSKAVVEKTFEATWRDYYVPAKTTVFHADKRNEKEHSAADVFRRGARVCYCNETTSLP